MSLPPAESGQRTAMPGDQSDDSEMKPSGAGSASPREVIQAIRATLDRALRAEQRLSVNDWKVLAVVLDLTAGWSKLDDDIASAEVAKRAGLVVNDPDGVASKHLRRLRERGVIEYEGGQSIPHRLGRVALRPPVLSEHELLRVPSLSHVNNR